ncbi:hypothetical protein FKM82_028080 [Ascaphus truei]
MTRPQSSTPDLLKAPQKKKVLKTNPSPRRERFSPGMRALMEIRMYQKTGNLLIERAPFSRLQREISMKYRPRQRLMAEALLALQEAAEAYMESLFQDSCLCSAHSNRATLRVEDLKLARRIRGERDEWRLCLHFRRQQRLIW